MPKRLREHLDLVRRGIYFGGFGMPDSRSVDPADALVEARLLLPTSYATQLPREVAIAMWLVDGEVELRGRPSTPPVAACDRFEQSAEVTASNALRAVTVLMDEAGTAPLAALKKGGVGKREQKRLSTRLSIPIGDLPLWIDIAFAAELLAETESGYTATGRYQQWRRQEPHEQWADLAWTWRGIPHSPTPRDIDDEGTVLEPPTPLMSNTGMMRRGTTTNSRC